MLSFLHLEKGVDAMPILRNGRRNAEGNADAVIFDTSIGPADTDTHTLLNSASFEEFRHILVVGEYIQVASSDPERRTTAMVPVSKWQNGDVALLGTGGRYYNLRRTSATTFVRDAASNINLIELRGIY